MSGDDRKVGQKSERPPGWARDEPDRDRRVVATRDGAYSVSIRVGSPSSVLNASLTFRGPGGGPFCCDEPMWDAWDAEFIGSIMVGLRDGVRALPHDHSRRHYASQYLFLSLFGERSPIDMHEALYGHEHTDEVIADVLGGDERAIAPARDFPRLMFDRVTLSSELLWDHMWSVCVPHRPTVNLLFARRGVIADGNAVTVRPPGDPAPAAWKTLISVIATLGLDVAPHERAERGTLSCAPRVLALMARTCRWGRRLVGAAVRAAGAAHRAGMRARRECSGQCSADHLVLPRLLDDRGFYSGGSTLAYACLAGRARARNPSSYDAASLDARGAAYADDCYLAAMYRFARFQNQLRTMPNHDVLLANDLEHIQSRFTRLLELDSAAFEGVLVLGRLTRRRRPVYMMTVRAKVLAHRASRHINGYQSYKICYRTGCIQGWLESDLSCRNPTVQNMYESCSAGRLTGLFDFDDPAVALLHMLLCCALSNPNMFLARRYMRHYLQCVGVEYGKQARAACEQSRATAREVGNGPACTSHARVSSLFPPLRFSDIPWKPVCTVCTNCAEVDAGTCATHREFEPLYDSAH